jgi:hypothetical protein
MRKGQKRSKEALEKQSKSWTPERRKAQSDKFSGDGNPMRIKGGHSPETKAKISEKMSGEGNPRFGCHLSDEQKHQISENNIGKHPPELCPWYGKERSDEVKQKISIKSKGHVAWNKGLKGISSGKNNGMYGKPCAKIKGDHYTKTDGSIIWLRSSYEIRVAKMLDKLALNWIYEPHSFSIDDSRTYRPDFYLIDLDIWWEVKGWLDEYARYKITKFWERYPEKTLRIIWKEDIEQLETLLKNDDLYSIIMIGQETLPC